MRLGGWEGLDMVSQVHEEREVRGKLEVDEVVGELNNHSIITTLLVDTSRNIHYNSIYVEIYNR